VVRRIVGPSVRIMAVVKANAYGHGAVPVARTLISAGASWLGVASIAEAHELRQAGGIAAPILVLGGIEAAHVDEAIGLDLTAVVWDLTGAARLAAAVPRGARLSVHLKVDTGMHRLGADPSSLGELAAGLGKLPFAVTGVMSHLACADEPGHPTLAEQRVEFERGLKALTANGVEPGIRHLANSAGLLADPRTHFDMVRPGIMLYGGLPHPSHAASAPLEPVMHFSTRIAQLRELPVGASVGYGHTFTCRRPTRIAVLPIGYADGYLRSLSNRGEVLVRGCRAPVVGRISMDHTTVDVTDVPGAATGDTVTLWGEDGGARLDVMEIGARAGTIGYELLSRVGSRVPRVHFGGEGASKP
jgi:alanine racemase